MEINIDRLTEMFRMPDVEKAIDKLIEIATRLGLWRYCPKVLRRGNDRADPRALACLDEGR